jgi:serine/threonine-protein kinase
MPAAQRPLALAQRPLAGAPSVLATGVEPARAPSPAVASRAEGQHHAKASERHAASKPARAELGAKAVQAGGVAQAAPGSESAAAVPAVATAAPGYLSLDSEPWSEVFLGSTSLGATPLMRVPLPPGKHVLTLKNSEIGRSTSYPVEIKSGSSVSRLVGWAQ